jgi:hypothetical protein
MDRMKGNVKNVLRILSGWLLVPVMAAGIAIAQQPSPTPKAAPTKKATPDAEVTSAQTGEDAGAYIITSSIEFGYRGIRVDGDINKYKSDLNYKAGPRLFDASFLMRSKDGKGDLFDSLLVTSTGWGADPYGSLRLSAEKPEWYRFDATYRRSKYYRFLNNIANPNWLFSPAAFAVPPNPATGEHGFNTKTAMGDFDLTILPKNRTIRFNVGYSPERYSGPAFSTYHFSGNEFLQLVQLKSQANDYRVGADGTLGPIDFSFLQGFRRSRDDSVIDLAQGINRNPAAAQATSFNRQEPARGSVNYTQFSLHSLVAKRLDITGRIVYSSSESNSLFTENSRGVNFNPRITGFPPTPPAATPNITNLFQYNITADTRRPSWLGDIGVTFLATDKFRISNTFRAEDFEINGRAVFSDFFSITRGALTSTIAINNLDANETTKYRKYQNTLEGDYQFNARHSIHFGYRYGSRRIERIFDGFNLGSNGSVAPAVRTFSQEVEQNHTHAFFGGFKSRPVKNWTLYFDAERGTADNVFTRIGNYDYTNLRLKSRYAPNRKISFNLAVIIKDNSNPSEIAGVSITDFGVDVQSRTFTSSLDWVPTNWLSLSTGYNYNWVNSEAVVDYFFQVPPAASVRHPLGRSQYFMRNNFFFIDLIARLNPRMTLFGSYRVNQDGGQGTRLSDPTGNPGTLINSYPMSFQSPEARLAIKINRHLDWNLGYQYYNYDENPVVGPRPQNYHAHLPYMSLRVYFGRKE